MFDMMTEPYGSKELKEQIMPSMFCGSAAAPPTFFSDHVYSPAERQVGFWNHHGISNGHVDTLASSTSQVLAPPLGYGVAGTIEMAIGSPSVDAFINPPKVGQSNLSCPSQVWRRGTLNKAMVNVNAQDATLERKSSVPSASWIGPHASRTFRALACSTQLDQTLDMVKSYHVCGDDNFSSFLPALLKNKLRLSTSDTIGGQPIDMMAAYMPGELEADDSINSLDELELHTIGNLLPDDDELLSGVVDDLDSHVYLNSFQEAEDFDLFSSGGGLELEGDVQDVTGSHLNASESVESYAGGSTTQHGSVNGSGSVAGEHPYGEHPSRTLFVRNINSNVEDTELRALFEQYGAIRTLYTACKHRGFVMISYYDIRAARSAMRALQNKPLRRRKLDIHFSIPKDNPSEKDVNQGTLVVFNLDASVSNDDLRQIFGVYGEVKEIRETPHKRHHKFIEFYDVRAAEAALRALNRSDIAGKRIKLEPSRPGGARRSLMQQLNQELDQEEVRSLCQQAHSPLPNSPPGHPPYWGPSHSVAESVHGTVVSLKSMINNSLNDVAVNLPPPISSAARVGALGTHLGHNGLNEGGKSLGDMELGGHRLPLSHPHSLPEFNSAVINHVQYDPSATSSVLAAAMAFRSGERCDGSYFQKPGNGSMSAVGSSELYKQGTQPLLQPHLKSAASFSGHGLLWGNQNSFHHAQSPQVIWQPSSVGPSYNNTGQILHQARVYLGTHDHLVKNVKSSSASHCHHVGLAPAMEVPILDRHHGYLGESPEASSLIRAGSLGALGLAGQSGIQALNLGRHNLINLGTSVGGHGFVDHGASSPSLGMMSPQQRTRIFATSGHPISLSATLEGANERGRIRKSEGSATQNDKKKQYQLDIDQILQGDDPRTTLMIKNIPNKYTSKMLLAAIDEHHRGTYDFFYLPIDFKNKCNVGYAFINMIHPSRIVPFYQAFNGKKWEKFNSEKVASLAYARIQGKAALIAHFQNSSLMNEDKRCRPILFHSEGPHIGDQEPFPVGINVRTRTNKSRSNNGESHQGSPTSSSSKDESVHGGDLGIGGSAQSFDKGEN